MEDIPFPLKVCMLKTTVMETLLYGCVTETLGQEHFAKLRTAHHKLLLRIMFSSADNTPTISCQTPRP